MFEPEYQYPGYPAFLERAAEITGIDREKLTIIARNDQIKRINAQIATSATYHNEHVTGILKPAYEFREMLATALLAADMMLEETHKAHGLPAPQRSTSVSVMRRARQAGEGPKLDAGRHPDPGLAAAEGFERGHAPEQPAVQRALKTSEVAGEVIDVGSPDGGGRRYRPGTSGHARTTGPDLVGSPGTAGAGDGTQPRTVPIAEGGPQPAEGDGGGGGRDDQGGS